MNFAELVEIYGYPVIFFGPSILEGESFLILGGLAAHAGFLKLYWVLLAAFCGVILGDFIWFLAGRHGGYFFIKKFPWLESISKKLLGVINKKPEAVAFSLRFMYGFRTAVPFSLGMSKINVKAFLFYNSLGALIWALIVGLLGYFFGELLNAVIGKVRHYEFLLIVVVILALVTLHLAVRFVRYLLRRNNILPDKK